MRCFWHQSLQRVYILPSFELTWNYSNPDGTPTQLRTLHCYMRQIPDRGYPEQECGLVPVQESMFRTSLLDLPYQDALQVDPPFVAYVERIVTYPTLPAVLTALPRRSKLYLLECWSTEEGALFDVYRVEGGVRTYLNPLLAPLLPSKEVDGTPHLLVPPQGTYQEKGAWLVQAIQARVWGAYEHSPAYTYEVEC